MSKNPSILEQDSVPAELKTIAATFLRVNARDVMERVKFRGERFIIKTFGRPMVVLISYEDYLCVRKYLPLLGGDIAAPIEPSSLAPLTNGTAGPVILVPLPESSDVLPMDLNRFFPTDAQVQ